MSSLWWFFRIDRSDLSLKAFEWSYLVAMTRGAEIEGLRFEKTVPGVSDTVNLFPYEPAENGEAKRA